MGQLKKAADSVCAAVQSIGCWCRKEEAQLNDPGGDDLGHKIFENL